MVPDLQIIAVNYPYRADGEYEPGTYFGIIVKRFNDGKLRVLFLFEDGTHSTSVLKPADRPESWIDVSFRAVVSMEEASEDERTRLFSYVSDQRLKVLLKLHCD